MSDYSLTEYLLFKRTSLCKLVLLALMWIQGDEDNQRSLSAEYSSPLRVENSTWLENTHAEEDIEHFRDVSNTVRMGIWLEVLQQRLLDTVSDLPTCLHDASLYALLAINLMLVDKELDGVYVHPQNEYFARAIAYETLSQLGNSEMTRGCPYMDFPLSLEEAKSLLPVDRKEDLEIELENFLIDTYHHDFQDDVPDQDDYPRDWLQETLKDFFAPANWRFDINKEAVVQLQEKYGSEYAEAAFSPQTRGNERWGKTLVYLKSYFGANSFFASSQSDLMLSEKELSELESSHEYVEDSVPPGYFRIKSYLTRFSDRTVALSQLVHTLVYFLLAGDNYHPSHLEDLMAIPTSSRVISSLQAYLAVAAYRSGYYMAASNIPESEVGRKWLLDNAFPNLRDFYQSGRSGAKNTGVGLV
jgi:hypothetical protein